MVATKREMASGQRLAAEMDRQPGPHLRGDPLGNLRGRARPNHWARPRREPHRRKPPGSAGAHRLSAAHAGCTRPSAMLTWIRRLKIACWPSAASPSKHPDMPQPPVPLVGQNGRRPRQLSRRGKKGDFPDKESIIGEITLLRSDLRRVDYRRSGQGQGDAVAWFDPLMVPDPEARSIALLGPLAWCRVAVPPPSPEPKNPKVTPMLDMLPVPPTLDRVLVSDLVRLGKPVSGLRRLHGPSGADLHVVETVSAIRVAPVREPAMPNLDPLPALSV